ncbi:MAG TPA: hypothetical protein VLY20_05765 [Nitrospiria bacterium]|nr:hypothetical protein [Nitrospiria bacterium]
MKFIKIFIIAAGAGLLTAGAALAENSLQSGAKALSFGIVDRGVEISGRVFPNNDLAVLGGIGIAHASNDESTTDYSLSAGVRKYLRRSDLAPFVGGEASFKRNDVVVGSGGGTDVESEKTFEIDGVFGVEYFFAKQVSVDAQVGVGISDIHNVNGSGANETQFGTFSSGVTVNFYLP